MTTRYYIKKGKDNSVADALSRCYEGKADCDIIHTVVPSWKVVLKDNWEIDELAQKITGFSHG